MAQVENGFGHSAVQVENGFGHSVGNGIGYGSAKINIELGGGQDVNWSKIHNLPGSEGWKSGNPMYSRDAISGLRMKSILSDGRVDGNLISGSSRSSSRPVE